MVSKSELGEPKFEVTYHTQPNPTVVIESKFQAYSILRMNSDLSSETAECLLRELENGQTVTLFRNEIQVDVRQIGAQTPAARATV